ncbi:MAG: hypothetical protein ACTSP9_07190 [Promethearchaeota archaeon]
MQDNNKEGGFFQIDWGRQGGVILGYIVVFFGYYGIIANTVMFDQYGNWISFTEMDKSLLIFTYQTYIQSLFLPAILLLFVSFFLTYKEDVPQYGIKASIWIVPFLIAQGFIFYFIMFGFSMEPFILQFASIEGYLNVLILYVLLISGSVCGMKLKQRRIKKLVQIK